MLQIESYMKDLRHLKKDVKETYDSIVSVFCPILNETVYFSSEGYNHLIYESNRKPRDIREQKLKLKSFPYVPRVLERCKRISDVRKVKRIIKGTVKEVFQYELIHEASPQMKIRVNVEKIGTGKHRFKSVMPHTKKDKIMMIGIQKNARRR